jgi:hypothetical protein
VRSGKVSGTSEVTEAIRCASRAVPGPGSGGGVTSIGGVVGAGVEVSVGGASDVGSGLAVPRTVVVQAVSRSAVPYAASSGTAARPRPRRHSTAAD